ncbi:hypothetical protein H4582DRAFT_2062853 [Lactarius indigo]|nr:hypothetical protein H4582DRAFT_2062853 [Lactarius indigo]
MAHLNLSQTCFGVERLANSCYYWTKFPVMRWKQFFMRRGWSQQTKKQGPQRQQCRQTSRYLVNVPLCHSANGTLNRIITQISENLSGCHVADVVMVESRGPLMRRKEGLRNVAAARVAKMDNGVCVPVLPGVQAVQPKSLGDIRRSAKRQAAWPAAREGARELAAVGHKSVWRARHVSSHLLTRELQHVQFVVWYWLELGERHMMGNGGNIVMGAC